ncbi:MAG: DNA (cytosine-5-)-methyltransferase [Candidatus Margulisiibacteriota bacterium]
MKNKKLTYISLFSGAGIGCYGFKIEGFNCIATVEIIEKRLNIQRRNHKCNIDSGYICGDLTNHITKSKVYDEYNLYKNKYDLKELDVILATPPCQGMSVANHKKKNEKCRNSLVIESIKITKELNPRFFVFENVRSFLTTECIDLDGKSKKIRDAIENNLGGRYHILFKIVNFKDYGSPSSRTRTIVIGSRKDIFDISPYDIFPKQQKESTLRKAIGHLPELKAMGDISPNDIFHGFRSYNQNMLNWIKDIKEGESAFNNTNKNNIPHKKIGGVIVCNANKNGDKYSRCYWDKPAPCVHTRNDILASQNTIHPKDNRVFSIRELMIMMSIPDSFRWLDADEKLLNKLSINEKREILRKEEMNIRQSIGEAVPTIIFHQIAKNIKKTTLFPPINDKNISKIISEYDLHNINKLKMFVKNNPERLGFVALSKIVELSNSKRLENAAYYTRQDICFTMINDLPAAEKYQKIRILEPSVGAGNFLPILIEKYKSIPEVVIDVIDVEKEALDVLRYLLKALNVPSNIRINFIHADYLKHSFDNSYDVIIGNPPFKKISNNKELLAEYKSSAKNRKSNNLFSFFMEKSLDIGNVVALIVPKSLINSPEYDVTRNIIASKSIAKITDYGEEAFKGVKIETVSMIINRVRQKKDNGKTKIESYVNESVNYQNQQYITSDRYPYWVIYRNEYFDSVSNKMHLGIFKAFRDRQITKKITSNKGKIRVLKSRNIGSNKVLSINNYDTYIDDASFLKVHEYINRKDAILVPNLTYYPRACFMPKNSISDGSVAILTPKNGSRPVTLKDLEYYNSEEFEQYYSIARNYGTRSLNIDSNSVHFFGIMKEV